MIDKNRALPIIDEMLGQLEKLHDLTRETGSPDSEADVEFVRYTIPIKAGLERIKQMAENFES